NAIQTQGGSGAGPRPTLRNLMVIGAGNYGISVGGGAMLGPNLQVTFSGKSGVYGAGFGAIDVSGSGNTFDNNVLHGIHITSTLQTLNFLGGSASNNGQNGIFLAGYSSISAPF